jgi:TRAP-type C4-dicarboxylate transport system substrate-binding protein
MTNWKSGWLVVGATLIGLLCCFHTSAFAQAKPVEVTFTLHHPAQDSLTLAVKDWGKEIEKRTNGRVTVTVFPGATLLAPDKCYDGVLRGIADAGMAVPANNRGRFPLTEVLELPLGYKSGLAATRLANEYFRKFKPKEFDEAQVLFMHAHGPGLLHSKKAVNKLEDIKGLKVRSTGLAAKIASAIGGAPVAMPVTEAYDALSRGVVDASLSPFETLSTFRWAEVIKFSTEISGLAYTTSFAMIMNKKKWNSLPPADRKIIEQINEEWIDKVGKTWDSGDKAGRDLTLKLGNKITSLPNEENEKVAQAVRPLLDDYVANMKKNGLPGDEALRFCVDQLKALQ